MPEESRFVGSSIEELLVSLAEGVREAQMALNAGPLVDPQGRLLASYQLPFLDFSIQVSMETRSSSTGRPIALLKMVPAAATSDQQTVASTISGRLVATPPGEGLPVPRIGIVAGPNIGGAARLTLSVANSAGEVLAGQRVELNIDDEDSARLAAARGLAGWRRAPGTRLSEAMLVTDEQGQAVTSLAIDAAEPGRAVIVVVATIGPFDARGVASAEVLG